MRKIALVVALCALSPLAAADVHSVGPVSFAVPDGLTYREEAGRATMGRVEGQSFVVVAITLPQPAVGDADANFRSLWTRIAQNDPPSPYAIKPKGGYGGKYAATTCKPKVTCILFTLETGKGVVPVFALIPEGQPDWNFFWPIHQSVRISPARAQPPKKNLDMNDMVGKWSWGASSTMAYVSSTSGRVVGASTNAVGSTYTFAADGSYTVSSQGINGTRTFKEESSGRVEFTPEVIVFHQKTGDKRYRFISYVVGVDGATIMTLLDASHDASSQNIELYAEDFVKPPG